MKDLMGREIEVGSLVAWPSRQGGSMWVTVGEVTGFGIRKPAYWSVGDLQTISVRVTKCSDDLKLPGKITTIYAIERVVLLRGPV